MKVSAELLKVLMRTIRHVERLEGVFTWSNHNQIYMNQILENELFFSAKIKNQDLKKINFYENRLLGREDLYSDLIDDAISKIKHRDLNKLLIEDLKKNVTYDVYEPTELEFINLDTIDNLINAGLIYHKCYLNFPNNDMKNEFATTIANYYMAKIGVSNFHMLFSEALNSNSVIFNASMLEREKFVIIYLKLIEGQCKKNYERIIKSERLIADNKIHFAKYGKKLEDYINTNTVFTITNFTEQNNISYNTAKKYLSELVELEILQPIKVGKNNAFVYGQMYNIWIK
jgi:hypothetical protein